MPPAADAPLPHPIAARPALRPEPALPEPALWLLLVLLVAAHGALGRDVFFNHLDHAGAAEADPVAPLLPYLRALLGLAGLALVAAASGVERTLAAAPPALAPYCLLALASVAWSTDPKGSLRDAGTLTLLWLALPAIVHRLGLAAAMRALLHLVAGVLIASAALALLLPEIGRHSGSEFAQFSHLGRWRGLFGHKNGLGPWAAVGAVFLFAHGRFLGGPRAYLWLARASAVACLLLSGSATALVLAGALAAGLAAVLALRRLTLGPVLLAGALGLAAAGLAAPLLGEPLLDWLGRGGTLSGRTAIWALAVERFAEAPWLGHGYGRSGGPEFLARVAAVFGQPLTGPESGYLALALDLGLVGAALFALAVLAALRAGLARLPDAAPDERAALALALPVVVAMPVAAITETGAVLCTGPYGVLAVACLLALLAPPR